MSTGRRVVRDGLVVGAIGYAAVALFYSVFDVLAARGPVFTVNMLGRALFRGVRDPAILLFPVTIDRGALLAYNALHLVAALAVGLFVTTLVARAEADPARRRWTAAALLAGGIATVFAVGLLSTPIRPLLPWWSIVVANVLAALAAGAWLAHVYPGVWGRLAGAPRGGAVPGSPRGGREA